MATFVYIILVLMMFSESERTKTKRATRNQCHFFPIHCNMFSCIFFCQNNWIEEWKGMWI